MKIVLYEGEERGQGREKVVNYWEDQFVVIVGWRDRGKQWFPTIALTVLYGQVV